MCEREKHREGVRGGRGRAGWYTLALLFSPANLRRGGRENAGQEKRVGRRLAAGVAARGGARERKVDGGKDGPRAGPT